MRGPLEGPIHGASALEIRALLVEEARSPRRTPKLPMKTLSLLAALLISPAAAAPSLALQGPKGPLETHVPPTGAGIAWFGTWDAALKEAERSRRPILFMSAAPQCQGVPGVW